MVAILQEKETFIGNEKTEENRDGKMKRGMFMVESRYYAKESKERSVYILCGCGNRTYIKREELILEGLNKLDYTCVCCGNDMFLSQRSYASGFAHFRDKEKMFQLAVAGFHYKFTAMGLWNSEHRLDNELEIGIHAIPIKFVVSTNKTSGITYQIHPNKQKIKNISRMGIIGEHEKGLMVCAFENVEHKEALLAWYKGLYENLPSYVTKEWRLAEKETDDCTNLLYKSRKLFLLHAYPYLRLMGRDIFFPFTRRKEREMAKIAEKKIDVYRIAVPAISKSTLMLLEDPKYFNAFNQIETLGMIQNKDMLRQAILTFQGTNYYTSDDKHVQIENVGTLFTQRVKKAFIRRFFQTNERFDKRMVMKNNLSKTRDNIYDVQDSLMMYERIKRETKELSPEKQQEMEDLLRYEPKESIHSLHDRLSVVLGMIVRENKEIRYTDAELSKWNKAYQTVDFRLVRGTHEMIKVGEQMNICVGGYDEGALAKEFLIIIGYVNEQPFICIQIVEGKIVQIKKKYNELLSLTDGEKTTDMRRYINETRVKLDTSDFNYELEELPMNLRVHRNQFGENQHIFNRENAFVYPEGMPFGLPYGEDPFANRRIVEDADDDLPF